MSEPENDKDSEDFVDLLTSHQGIIRAYIISLLPGSPGVDDVIQNTNRTLWINRSNYKLGTNFKAWALTMSRFQVMAYRKTMKRQGLVALDEDILNLIALESQEEDEPLEELHQALGLCLKKLQTNDRELLLHRYWSNIRLKDYAITAKMSVGALKLRLFRLRAALKDCINQQLEQPHPPQT